MGRGRYGLNGDGGHRVRLDGRVELPHNPAHSLAPNVAVVGRGKDHAIGEGDGEGGSPRRSAGRAPPGPRGDAATTTLRGETMTLSIRVSNLRRKGVSP